MANHIATRNIYQKNIVDTLIGMCGRFSRWQIWQDFITMVAISISNAVDKVHYEEREKLYMNIAGKYSQEELNKIATMFANIVSGMEKNTDQDFLGELFMNLDLGNEWKGQFFTPYSVCSCMAGILLNDEVPQKIAEKGWVSVNNPACGAGALLIAYANECWKKKINYQSSVLFIAQDIDQIAGLMCYIQLSLLGCPGYVVVQNTLTNPATSNDGRGLLPVDSGNVWYTPMWFSTPWSMRRMITKMDMLFKSQPQTANECVSVGNEQQLSLF